MRLASTSSCAALASLLAAAGCSIPAPAGQQGASQGVQGQFYFVNLNSPPVGGLVTSDAGLLACGAARVTVDSTVSPPQYAYDWFAAGSAQTDLCGPARIPWASEVTLTATPRDGNVFVGWAGSCSGTSPTCTLSAGADKSVVAVFGPSGSGHPSFSDPALHGPAYGTFLAQASAALQCSRCHGATLDGGAFAPSCAACHAWPLGSVVSGPACTPAVCRAGIECGVMTDGCGGTIDCGDGCVGGRTCGGGGRPNACGGGGASSGLFLDGFFPVGAFNQTSYEMASWKAIGANTVQGMPNLDHEGWANEARRLGLRQIRQPFGSVGAYPPAAGNYASVLSDPDFGTGNVLAWMGVMPNSTSWDEIEYSIGPAASTAQYAINTGNALHALDPLTPTFLNTGINGLGPIASGWPYVGGTFNYTMLLQSIDWVCNDIYPYGGSGYNASELRGAMGGDHVVTSADVATYPLLAPMQGKGAIASIGVIADKQRAVAPGKALFAYVEAGCVIAGSPVVPPGGIRAEMWDAVIHGARGIMVFAYVGQLNRATSDGHGCAAIPAANAAEIRAQSALLTSLGSVLQDEIDPATLDATPSLPALEAGWRDTPSGKYFFVLNTTNVDQGTAAVTLRGVGAATSATVIGEGRTVPVASGVIRDAFGPYAVHIYHLP